MAEFTEQLLRDSLERLGAEAERQARYVRDLGLWPSLDELALELDDVAGAAESWMTPEATARVRALSNKLGEMSGEANAHLWEPTALGGPEWADVRVLARQALAALDE